MPSDDERDSGRVKLTKRDEFLSWKRKTRFLAMDKGDVYELFDEDGTRGVYAALGGARERTKWANLARQLVGTIGKTIVNETLQEVWSRLTPGRPLVLEVAQIVVCRLILVFYRSESKKPETEIRDSRRVSTAP